MNKPQSLEVMVVWPFYTTLMCIGKRMSEKLNLPLLASIPLHMDVCTRGDFGAPIIVSDPFHQVSNIYKNLCLKLEKEIA